MNRSSTGSYHAAAGMTARRWLVPMLGAALFGIGLLGCGKKETETPGNDDVLVTVNDSSLRMRDVLLEIPVGTAPEDSVRLFHAIVNSWVDDRLLESVAEENIDDLDRIEALVSDYRRKLIVEAYKRKVRQTAPVKLSEDSMKRYYNTHIADLKLESPLVKGLYIKLPQESPRSEDVRKWVFSASPDAIDALEKYGLEEAVQYDYFMDRWIEFGSLAEQIPYRFYDADAFLKSTKDFETSYNGFVYLVHITAYIPTGETMPYDYARRVVSDRLGDEQLNAYQRRLMTELRKNALGDGRLRTPGYDLGRGRVTLGKLN
ncbi:MAG: hypothetical protein HDS31_03610 [Bacteroides sp.]|nr:hypothetical protein [Bacteroides sp.]